MKKIKCLIVSLAIINITTALLIHAIDSENLSRGTRSLFIWAWFLILIVTLILHYVNFKDEDNK